MPVTSPPAGRPRARVVLLGGPSGSGKSRIAVRSGLPVVTLDDFYRSGDAPDLPRLPGGQVDWDDVRTWQQDEALAALEQLCRTGSAEIPCYDLAANGPTGTRTVRLDGAGTVVAEGIFVATLIGQCRERGLLVEAVCLHRSRWLTFVLRLFRDLRERRKPPLFLLRRGLGLALREPAAVRALVDAGCRPLSRRRVERLLAAGRA